MKKSDLKTGMLVENRNGKIGLVMLQTSNGDVLVGGGNIPDSQQTWSPFRSLNEDLTYPGLPGSDIVKVYEFPSNSEGASFKKDRRNLIWERKDTIIELTSDYDAIVDTNTRSVKVYITIKCN